MDENSDHKDWLSNYAGVHHLAGWGGELGAVCCSPDAIRTADETFYHHWAICEASVRAEEGASAACKGMSHAYKGGVLCGRKGAACIRRV